MSFPGRSTMRKYLLPCLICVEAALLLTGCFPRLLMSGMADGHETLEMEESTSVSSAPEEKRYEFIFRAGGKELSGMIIARREGEDSVRAVGTTWFGLSLFDLTVTRNSYRINSCADFLDSRAFASFLASRIRKEVL